METQRIPCATAILAAALLLVSGCGTKADVNHSPNEAPPAAPFGINVQNQNDDNNLFHYKESAPPRSESYSVQQSGGSSDMPQRMAEAVAGIDGVRTAHVLVSGDQAYVAVMLQNGGRGREPQEHAISQTLKGTISDKLRTMDPSVRHVYVTDRTEDLRRFETLRTELREGRPVQELMRELSESITRTIPDWSIGNLTPGSLTPAR